MPTYLRNWLKYYVTTALLIGLIGSIAFYFLFACYAPLPIYGDGWDRFGGMMHWAVCTQLPSLILLFGSIGILIVVTILDGIFRFVFKNENSHKKVIIITLELIVLMIAGLVLISIFG